MTNKTICFFNSNREWGGGEKWHLETAKWLRDKGYHIIICAYKGKELYYRSVENSFETIAIKISNFSFLNPVKIFLLFRKFKRHHLHAVIMNLSSDVKTASIAAKLAGIKKIIYRRGMALPVKNSFINRYIFKNLLTKIIVNSIDIKNKLLINHPYLEGLKKIEIIYNGVDISNYSKMVSIVKKGNNKVILGNVGRLVEQKAQKYLLELAFILKSKKLNFEIWIAGTGKLENELKQKVLALNVNEHVKFLGFIKDLKTFYNEIDIFILSSVHEGISNALIEAMAYGKPVIAFDISSMPEMVTDNFNGFLVEYANINELAEKASKLIDNHDLREKMGNNSLAIVNQKFNIEKNLKNIITFVG